MSRYARPVAVAFLSASTLAYEILLVRVFAIEQFHHFAYMAISIAMLGFGTSGTFLALIRPDPNRSRHLFVWMAVLVPVLLIASITLVHRIPLDSAQLLWDPWQWPRLAAIYVILALPFGAAALAILLALILEQRHLGLIYGASFLGAGLGAAIALVVLWWFFPIRALAVPAMVGACGSLSAVSGATRRRRVAAWVVFVLAAAALAHPVWTLNITPYKGLPQVEAYPDARRTAERNSPLGWVVAVEAEAFRHAPGLSLSYVGEFPRQTALFVDAELADASTTWDAESAREIFRWLPSAAPYAVGQREEVLILGAGGGTEIWNALANGAGRVKAVELNAELARLGGWETLTPSIGETAVAWVIGDARGFVARSSEQFDLITIGASQAFGTSAGGVHALNEDFMHTVEAYVQYLDRLSDDGVLAITRWVTVPPRASVRVILAAAEALRRHAPESIASGLVVMRSWATATVLVKPSGFSDREVEALSAWATERRFDLDWYPGLAAPRPGYNVLEPPVLFDAAVAAVTGQDSAARFAASYTFDVEPVSDARPYPHHFLRAGSVREFIGRDRGSWLAFAEWGYITLFATLVQSLVLAGLLMLVPAVIGAGGGDRRQQGRLIVYFAAIGFAYLAAEIAAIQQLSLLLGHPVYAVAAVLTAFLICSGAGSAWSDRLRADRLVWAVATLTAMLVIYSAALLVCVHLLQPARLALRAAVGLLVLVPLAFQMGLPFPMGLRALAGTETEDAAWAWAANGFASVVATPLAALIALELGSQVLFLSAAAGYAVAAGFGRGWAKRDAVGHV